MAVGRGCHVFRSIGQYSVYSKVYTAVCAHAMPLQVLSNWQVLTMLETTRDLGEDDDVCDSTTKQDVFSLVTDATAMCVLFCVILYAIACTVLLMTVDATSTLFM